MKLKSYKIVGHEARLLFEYKSRERRAILRHGMDCPTWDEPSVPSVLGAVLRAWALQHGQRMDEILGQLRSPEVM
jgi:hypothetical protein